ncbi:MAG: hypothetical protein RIK87_27010 [Fuerstiella sp.]
MLLTNTINTLTINTTIAVGNVIVCGVEFRGCSACPAQVADRPAEKPAASHGRKMLRGRALHAMYFGHDPSWQWLSSDMCSSRQAAGLRIGRASGRSLS